MGQRNCCPKERLCSVSGERPSAPVSSLIVLQTKSSAVFAVAEPPGLFSITKANTVTKNKVARLAVAQTGKERPVNAVLALPLGALKLSETESKAKACLGTAEVLWKK